MTRAVVIGAGIAGLAAARRLAAERATGRLAEVIVLEGSDRPGGKLRREIVAGIAVDVGAEAMLNRRPEGVDLARDAGLEVVHPALAKSTIYSRGELRPLPRSLMGVPLDLEQLEASGVLSDEALAKVRAEPTLPAYDGPGSAGGAPHSDVSVGELVEQRFGPEVVDRLVEPLLGGVYAGHARELSALASVPQLVAWAEKGSLLEQGAAIPQTYDAPVFAAVKGGMGLFAETLAEQLVADGVELRVNTTARGLAARPDGGFTLTVGSAADPETLDADLVVLATPARPTGRLLETLAPQAASLLSRFEAASVAVVTMAFGRDQLPAEFAEASGFLVPPIEDLMIKASTWSMTKWAWVADAGVGAGPNGEDLAFLRTSLGRHREEATLQRSDAELVEVSLADLHTATGLTATPVDAHVQRWGGGLPQYEVGHLNAVALVHDDVARVPGLAVCGAAYDGVGIPAVIASADRAVAEVLSELGSAPLSSQPTTDKGE